MLLAVLLITTLLVGCGENVVPATEYTRVDTSELTAELQRKYAETQKVTYTNAIYEAARNESFLIQVEFDPIAAGMEAYTEIAALYYDSDLTDQAYATYDWADDAKRSFIISPGPSPKTGISQVGVDETTPGYSHDAYTLFDKGEAQDWGNYGTMYLARFVDLATGEKLDKPIVSVVTFKGELDTPDVRFTATNNGIGMFIWDAVKSAERYLILKIEVSESGSTGHALVIGQTSDTYWAPPTDQMDSKTYVANNAFRNYWLSEDDLQNAPDGGYDSEYDPADGPVRNNNYTVYYTVVAVNAQGTSMFSEFFSGEKIAAQLPHSLGYTMDRQSEQGFQAYVDGVLMMPSHRWIVMCDGKLAHRLINYDFDNISQEQVKYYYYEEEDMSDLWAEMVPVLKIPFIVENTPFNGVLTVENYDEQHWQDQIEQIKARQESLRSKTGDIERGITVQDKDDEEPADDDQYKSQLSLDEKITANSALSEYLAISMINSNEVIDLTAFPEASDQAYLIDAWMEAFYQNPLVLGISDVFLSYDRTTLFIEYEDDASTRAQKQQEIKKTVNSIVGGIITNSMTDLEKQYAINDYLCDTATYCMASLENAQQYDFQKVDPEYYDSFTAYGVLINNVGVCASYAAGFKLLAEAAGLESIVVTGYLEGTMPHAWNRVNLDGNWETIDVTNNDMDFMPNVILNVPDSALTSILIEDDRYVMNSHLSVYVSENTEAEYYRVSEKYHSVDEIAHQFAELLKTNTTVVLRTDYAITDEQFYEIGGRIIELTQNPNIGGCYWMGVIFITSEM